MDTLLPLSALIGLLASYRAYFLVSRKRNSTINDPILRGKHPLEKSVNRGGGPVRIFIPNVLVRWPWSRKINPNYAVVKKEAGAWIASFQAFNPKAQDAFNLCDFSQ